MTLPASIAIDGRLIGNGLRPYVIAELSGNHNGDLGRALAVMEEAKRAGADAVKLQTYTADTMTIDHDGPGFVVDLPLWKGRKLYELYKEAATPWEWHDALFAKGRELDITVFSTPFDASSVEFLESQGVPAFKIASFENTDLPLIRRVAATGKPVIMSTGMATEPEIAEAVAAARGAGCRDLVLLHCVSSYPAPPEDANLANIPELARRFDVLAGLSDHTLGTEVAVAAVALGAVVLEKHVTLKRADGGVDSAFSLEPAELAELCRQSAIVSAAIGCPNFGPKSAEMGSLKFRRSLYAVADIAKGGALDDSNVRSIRPGFGLPPKYLDKILGSHACRDIRRGEPLTWDMIGK